MRFAAGSANIMHQWVPWDSYSSVLTSEGSVTQKVWMEVYCSRGVRSLNSHDSCDTQNTHQRWQIFSFYIMNVWWAGEQQLENWDISQLLVSGMHQAPSVRFSLSSLCNRTSPPSFTGRWGMEPHVAAPALIRPTHSSTALSRFHQGTQPRAAHWHRQTATQYVPRPDQNDNHSPASVGVVCCALEGQCGSEIRLILHRCWLGAVSSICREERTFHAKCSSSAADGPDYLSVSM